MPVTARFNEQQIDLLFAAINQCELPGGAVGIAIDGTPVYRKGFGRASIELPVMLSPTMRMRIGSTTKHFACLAFMLLCEEGQAEIDDEIGRYIPGMAAVNSRATMRHLMGHISGIRDPLSISMVTNGINRPVTEKQMLAYYETIEDTDFAPTTQWSYNNGAYALLTASIETISGVPIEDFLRARIFEPVGMFDTMLRRWDTNFVPNSATLHQREADGSFSRNYMGMEITGAGGIVSTMDDMLRWLKHMDAPVVGSISTWELMRRPMVLTNGFSTGYGLGLMSGSYRGVEILHHAGGVMGGNSQMIKVPAAKLDVSIAVNRSDISAFGLAFEVIDACVDGLEPVTEETITAKPAGTFISKQSGRIATLSVHNETQLLSVDGSAPTPMRADAHGVLQAPPGSPIKQSVRIEDNRITLVEFGNEDELLEIEPLAGADLRYSGAYRSEMLDTTMSVETSADGPRLISRGRHGSAAYKLDPVTANVWKATQSGFAAISWIVTFDDEGLTVDFTRLRHARFHKVS